MNLLSPHLWMNSSAVWVLLPQLSNQSKRKKTLNLNFLVGGAYNMLIVSPVKGKDPPIYHKGCPDYVSNGEASFLEIRDVWSIHSLTLLPGSILTWSGSTC